MGRTQPSVVMRPNTIRRADRAKKAKDTINKAIPDLLRSSPRARHGIHKALLVTDLEPLAGDCPSHASDAKLRIRLQDTDTLTAARRLTQYSRRASFAPGAPTKQSKTSNVCILNMASPLRPGGGFLDGATSQEEFLCMRTTLYPSLWDDFYRLPEVGGVFTPDVLVFRDSTPDAEDLGKRDRFFADVITAAMIRFPETNRNGEGDEEKTGCSCGVSYCDKDRELVTRKMRAVLRMAQQNGAERLVLGAWGCGAYGNPVREVAKIWKRVICGTARNAESWSGIKEIVFAINDRAMLKEFEKCFSDVLLPASEPVSPPSEPAEVLEKKASDQVAELVTKIQETEMQLDQISNPRSKARLREVLVGLNKQLIQIGLNDDDALDEDLPLEMEAEDMDGFLTSDPEDNSYYHFDEDDIASSGSTSPASIFEFKSRHQDESFRRLSVCISNAGRSPDDTVSTLDQDDLDRSPLDETSGWFSGSINGLSALLNMSGKGDASPVLRPDSMGNDVEPLNLENYLSRYSSQES